MKKIDVFVLILLIVGGINWGFWGVVDFNIIDYIFGRLWIDKVIYFLVGVSAFYALFRWKSFCCFGKKK